MDGMSGPDLFDVLAAEDSPDVVHMVLPSFVTACGRDYLDVSCEGEVKGRRLLTLTSSKTTCPACLAAGEAAEGLSALCRRISGNQPTPKADPNSSITTIRGGP